MSYITRFLGELVHNNLSEKPSVGDEVVVPVAGELIKAVVKGVLHNGRGDVEIDLEKRT